MLRFFYYFSLGAPSLLLPAPYLRTVAAFFPGSIAVFTTLPRRNGMSKLKPSARKGGISK
jgi:hypothetical protein